jgi:hypothetical protein
MARKRYTPETIIRKKDPKKNTPFRTVQSMRESNLCSPFCSHHYTLVREEQQQTLANK